MGWRMAAVYAAFLALGVGLIIIGFEGSLGLILACIFVPGSLQEASISNLFSVGNTSPP